LTGRFKRFEDLAEDDFRRHSPRFQGENFQKNLDVLQKIEQLAAKKGVTPSQLALAWVMAQGRDIVPIPGTKRVKYLEENAAAANITLTSDELDQIGQVSPKGVAAGTRYAPEMMRFINM
jgi:aryl-alcohol dehydrogenase-like predicted oxidoreductase